MVDSARIALAMDTIEEAKRNKRFSPGNEMNLVRLLGENWRESNLVPKEFLE